MDFKIYCKAVVIKMVQYQRKNNQSDQWNRIESLDINPNKCMQLNFDKGAKAIPLRKDSL